jgi:ATP-dependent DNA helicase RecQ
LSVLLGICETVGCRRQALLAHFGERHPGHCGNCDTCLSPVETFDGTQAARKALSAVYRTGQRYGAGHVIDVLRGEATEKAVKAGHDTLPTFGVGKDMDARAWQSVLRQLVAAGTLTVDHDAHGALVLGEGAREVLRGEVPVVMRRDRVFKATGGGARRRDRAAAAPGGAPDPLFEALRAERLRIAREQGLAPYMVFHDSTLREMTLVRPRNRDELAMVQGVGQAKLARYATAFLAVIAAQDAGAQAIS